MQLFANLSSYWVIDGVLFLRGLKDAGIPKFRILEGIYNLSSNFDCFFSLNLSNEFRLPTKAEFLNLYLILLFAQL
jgi:hypothetical protein